MTSMDAWQKFKQTGEEQEALKKAQVLIKQGARWGSVWRVTYRREGWTPGNRAYRTYTRSGAAWNFVEKLEAGRQDLGDVEYTLERIWTLGDWEVISER